MGDGSQSLGIVRVQASDLQSHHFLRPNVDSDQTALYKAWQSLIKFEIFYSKFR